MMRMMTMTLAAALLAAGARGAGSAAASPMRSRLARAYRLKEANRPADSIAAFKAVLKADPGNSEALAQLGRLHAALDRWPEAAGYFRRVVEQDPGDMGLRMELAGALAAMKDAAGAAAELRVVVNEPGELREKAREALRAMGAGDAPPAADARRAAVEEGWTALRRGDRVTARRRFEAALALEPRDAALLKQLGFLDLYDGRTDEAVRNLETARALDAQDCFVALQLGYLYARLDRKERARDAFTAALTSPDERIHAAALAALAPSSGRAAASRPKP